MHVVGCQQHGGARQSEQLQPFDQLELGAVIQREGRLVQQQDGGPVDEGFDQVELSLHSERVLADELIPCLREAAPLKELIEPVAGELRCQSELTREEPGILIARHLVEMRGLVQHHAQPASQ